MADATSRVEKKVIPVIRIPFSAKKISGNPKFDPKKSVSAFDIEFRRGSYQSPSPWTRCFHQRTAKILGCHTSSLRLLYQGKELLSGVAGGCVLFLPMKLPGSTTGKGAIGQIWRLQRVPSWPASSGDGQSRGLQIFENMETLLK